MSLTRLFDPESIAVVGASGSSEKIGHTIFKNLLESDSRIYAVNPYLDSMLGRTSYPSVSDLPERVDLAVIAIPAQPTVEVVKECAEVKIPFVIPVASGFSEVGEGGALLQQGLLEMVKGTETRILGPNTLGVLVPRNNLDTFFTPRERSPRPGDGPLAIVSQSGSVLTGVFETANDENVGVSCCVGLGNKVDLNENDFLEYLGQDEDTECICLYLESFQDGEQFLELCEEISPEKPIVAVKVGRTEQGQKAAASHTGALALSSDSLVSGVFRQFGVSRAYDEIELLDLSRALAYLGHIEGDRIAVVSSAGGFGVIAADYITSQEKGMGMRMAEFSEDTKKRIIDCSLHYASAENPIDLTGGATDEMYDTVLRNLQEEKSIDVILLLVQLQTPGTTRRLLDITEKWCKNGKKPIVVCSIGGEYTRDFLKEFEERRIPSYNSLRRSILALKSLYQRGEYLKRVGAIPS